MSEPHGTDSLVELARKVPLTAAGGFRHFDRELGTWLRIVIACGPKDAELAALVRNAREGERVLAARVEAQRRPEPAEQPLKINSPFD